MQRLNDALAWADSRRELWLDCIRVYLGLGLFARGLLLVTNASPGYLEGILSGHHLDWALVAGVLHYVILAHFVGGAFLALGLFTRAAALVQVPVLFGAVFLVHRQDGLFAMGQSLEFSALVLFLLCVLTVSGAGKFSLDHVIFDARELEPPHHDHTGHPRPTAS